jgi:hypothetical protein
MDEGFKLPVCYRGKELLFPAQLVSFGWTHRIQVDVYGTIVFFEKDEERECRALLSLEDLELNKEVDVALIKAIGAAIEEMLK